MAKNIEKARELLKQAKAKQKLIENKLRVVEKNIERLTEFTGKEIDAGLTDIINARDFAEEWRLEHIAYLSGGKASTRLKELAEEKSRIELELMEAKGRVEKIKETKDQYTKSIRIEEKLAAQLKGYADSDEKTEHFDNLHSVYEKIKELNQQLSEELEADTKVITAEREVSEAERDLLSEHASIDKAICENLEVFQEIQATPPSTREKPSRKMLDYAGIINDNKRILHHGNKDQFGRTPSQVLSERQAARARATVIPEAERALNKQENKTLIEKYQARYADTPSVRTRFSNAADTLARSGRQVRRRVVDGLQRSPTPHKGAATKFSGTDAKVLQKFGKSDRKTRIDSKIELLAKEKANLERKLAKASAKHKPTIQSKLTKVSNALEGYQEYKQSIDTHQQNVSELKARREELKKEHLALQRELRRVKQLPELIDEINKDLKREGENAGASYENFGALEKKKKDLTAELDNLVAKHKVSRSGDIPNKVGEVVAVLQEKIKNKAQEIDEQQKKIGEQRQEFLKENKLMLAKVTKKDPFNWKKALPIEGVTKLSDTADDAKSDKALGAALVLLMAMLLEMLMKLFMGVLKVLKVDKIAKTAWNKLTGETSSKEIDRAISDIQGHKKQIQSEVGEMGQKQQEAADTLSTAAATAAATEAKAIATQRAVASSDVLRESSPAVTPARADDLRETTRNRVTMTVTPKATATATEKEKEEERKGSKPI